jgi:hypothetical protein
MAARPPLAPVDVDLEAKMPQPIFPWLELGNFFPPGAVAIYPHHGYRPPHLLDTPRAWFPSTAECTSRLGNATLYHEAEKSGEGMSYVVFHRDEPTKKIKPVFEIRKALEVLWSPDGSRAAITILTGSNTAAVVILPMATLKASEPIDPSSALARYLPPYLVQAPQFIMALRWTTSGELVLRARGEEPAAPYPYFGYEVSVDTDHPDLPGAIEFLRGYRGGTNPRGASASADGQPAAAAN